MIQAISLIIRWQNYAIRGFFKICCLFKDAGLPGTYKCGNLGRPGQSQSRDLCCSNRLALLLLSRFLHQRTQRFQPSLFLPLLPDEGRRSWDVIMWQTVLKSIHCNLYDKINGFAGKNSILFNQFNMIIPKSSQDMILTATIECHINYCQHAITEWSEWKFGVWLFHFEKLGSQPPNLRIYSSIIISGFCRLLIEMGL